jgi:hypothetical protein
MFVNSEDLAQATVVCANSEGEILADFSEPFSPAEVTGESTITPVKRLMDQLKKHEICPYTGTVNIEVKSDKDESSSSSTPCDAGLIVTDVEIKSNSTLRWELIKESLAGASGTVTYDLKENYKTVSHLLCARMARRALQRSLKHQKQRQRCRVFQGRASLTGHRYLMPGSE